MLVDCMDYSKLVRGRINDMVHVYREREGGGGPNRMGKEKKKKKGYIPIFTLTLRITKSPLQYVTCRYALDEFIIIGRMS